MDATAPALIQMIAIAIALGILAQVLAHKVRLPSIVFLLVLGILAGPDGAGWIDTDALGIGLEAIVTVAVALILFEGGLQIHVVDLAAVGRTVRNLVTIGVVVTVIGAAAAAHYVAGFPWRLAFLFGAIVSVTGPTVINPLLDRVRVQRRIDTVLRGEGIVVDPIGAILAVVALEIVMTTDSSIWTGLRDFALRMGIGVAVGLAGGLVLGRILRARRLLPDEIKNLFVLAWVLGLFAIADSLAAESGLAAVVIAGMTVRRESIPREHELRRFKSELSVLFISLLFILLSAHLPLSTIEAVGWAGVWTVMLLMWVVRPLNVLLSAWRTDLTWRERLFAMWISPRGVVAISISSFVGLLIQSRSTEIAGSRLTPQDGEALMALVFLTIAITVVVQGLTTAPISRLLGLAATSSRYAVIVGADSIGRVLASELRTRGWDTLLIDSNPRHVAEAHRIDLAALNGNALDRSVMNAARVEDASLTVATTENQEVNFLACQLAREEYQVPAVFPALVDRERGPRERLMDGIGGLPAFAEQVDVAQWNHDLGAERAKVLTAIIGRAEDGALQGFRQDSGILPLLVVKGDAVDVAHAGLRLEKGHTVVALVRNGAEARFREVSGRETAATGAPPS